MKITKDHIGKKIRKTSWGSNHWIKVIDVSDLADEKIWASNG